MVNAFVDGRRLSSLLNISRSAVFAQCENEFCSTAKLQLSDGKTTSLKIPTISPSLTLDRKNQVV